jgi:hypothetical protein
MYLSQIFVYPIKSAQGAAVTETALDISGPVRDRRWMLVDEQGVFLSQRTVPGMALVSPRFEGLDLVVTAPGMSRLVIRKWSGEGEWISVSIWRDQLRLPHPNQIYSDWFSDFLGRTCRLVCLPDTVRRQVEAPFDQPEWRVSLADGYPLLLVSQASLDLLNEKLSVPVGMERFRPNLVISGTAPHEEDSWRRLQIGAAQFMIVKPCARCSVVLVNPSTGERELEPLRTLAGYRKQPQKVMFAQNALVTHPDHLRVGAAIQVLEMAHLERPGSFGNERG